MIKTAAEAPMCHHLSFVRSFYAKRSLCPSDAVPLFVSSAAESPANRRRKHHEKLSTVLLPPLLPYAPERQNGRMHPVGVLRPGRNAHSGQPLRSTLVLQPRPPFVGMLFCGICGAPVNFYYFKGKGFVMKTVYRCSSRKTRTAKAVEGVTYTPPHKSNYTKNPSPGLIEYREKYGGQYLQPRPMICTDIRIPIDRPPKAFIQAWNYIIGQRGRYHATLKRTVDNNDDVLVRCRAREMLALFDSVGRLSTFDFPLMLITLD